MFIETSEGPEYLTELGEGARDHALWIAKSLIEAGVEAEKSIRIAVCTAKRLAETDHQFPFVNSNISPRRSSSSHSNQLGLPRESSLEPLSTEESPSTC